MWMVSDALERECEYSHLLASSVTSPNQKSYTSPKWKTKQNKRMTERQEESNKHNITTFKIAIKFIVNRLISYNTRTTETTKQQQEQQQLNKNETTINNEKTINDNRHKQQRNNNQRFVACCSFCCVVVVLFVVDCCFVVVVDCCFLGCCNP